MPTKVASYLTELGFTQVADVPAANNLNKSSGGEFIVVKSLGRMYRYDGNATDAVNNVTVLATSDGGNTRWMTVGGSSMTQEKITGSFASAGSTITLPKAIASTYEVLSVNIGNTAILSSQYSITINSNNTVISLLGGQTIPAGTGYEVILFSGNTQMADTTDYAILPATLYQHMMTLSSNTVALNKNFTIYKKTVSAASTFNFTIPSDYQSAYGVITFELFIDMTTASNILWTPTISWSSGTAPLFNEVKKYLLSFRSFDAGTTWIGHLEMEW